ncbi:hypothetical protein ACE0DR_28825 [Azotobacter sp. CWF10]
MPDRTALRCRPRLRETKAEPNADESYSITGIQIFITAGERDLTEEHRAPGAGQAARRSPGAKGISLFVTPKFKVDRDGNVGERNALRCGSIEAQDGHQGFGHLRDELRWRAGLPGRPAAQGPAGDVRHDEHRARTGSACRASACPSAPTRTR